jgi:2-methylisocitrate lyase-like PEP mutase family enzyme
VITFPVPQAGDRVQLGAGVHDALTARLAERAGFDVLWLGSLEVSARYGVPDANVLTMTEMAAVVAEVRAVCRRPLYVDADNGYGDDLAAARAARMFEAAGADAVCLEDNVFPKRNSLLPGLDRPLVEPAEFAERLAVVCKSRTRMAVIARTEALVAGLGVDAAVTRLRRYAEVGVDALFVQVNRDCRHLLRPVLARLDGLLPVVLAPTALPDVPAARFGDWGAGTVLFANLVLRTIIAALPRTMAAVREHGLLAAAGDGVVGVGEALALVDQDGTP